MIARENDGLLCIFVRTTFQQLLVSVARIFLSLPPHTIRQQWMLPSLWSENVPYPRADAGFVGRLQEGYQWWGAITLSNDRTRFFFRKFIRLKIFTRYFVASRLSLKRTRGSDRHVTRIVPIVPTFNAVLEINFVRLRIVSTSSGLLHGVSRARVWNMSKNTSILWRTTKSAQTMGF